jgi:hypothetical protein
MTRKKRKWDEILEEDPAAGLLNLFDVWIAFAAALLLAIASYMQTSNPQVPLTKQAANQNPSRMETLKANALKIPHYRATSQPLGGEGQRLGAAYRLKSGEVVCVPDDVDGKN